MLKTIALEIDHGNERQIIVYIVQVNLLCLPLLINRSKVLYV